MTTTIPLERIRSFSLLWLFVALVLLGVGTNTAAGEKISIAAAANLTYVLDPLNAAFSKSEPDVVIEKEIGASGNLVAQILNGGPYDLFLSADMEFPRKLVTAGAAEGPSVVTFAYGKLVLWTTRSNLELGSVESVLRTVSVRKVAIANPKTAPYGRAAMEVLSRLNLLEEVEPKVVTGENITQTAQFVSSGNADVGFVAFSLVSSPNLREKGRWLAVPGSLYTPIAQGAVLTRLGAANPAARRYLRFLSSAAAREILAQFGYGLP